MRPPDIFIASGATKSHFMKLFKKLDPVGSTVCYEMMMKLCTGSVLGHYEAVAVGN